jgi:methionyl-tRNA formyltransferase
MTKPSVVFFGTGPVAAKSLELLLDHCEVEAVITKPKPPHHRGAFPVADIANNNNLKTYEVTDKKSLSALVGSAKFESHIGVLIDFGIIVSQDVIDNFEKGIINSHFSLLPEWRGADPITFSILSGQRKTGVSLMLLVESMDEGPLLAVGVKELDGTETVTDLTNELIHLSDALLKKELPRYLSGESQGVEQSKMSEMIPNYPSKPSYSRKIAKQDGILDFSKTAEVLEREIRAFADWPKSRMNLNGIEIVVESAHITKRSGTPGDYEFSKNELVVFCEQDALSIDSVKPAGKSSMPISAFLAGYRKKL